MPTPEVSKMAEIDLESPSLYINRELSLLEFQRRVLEEAFDDDNPLLERVKFTAIFGSNMDEFFMVRVSGIRKQVEANIIKLSEDGLTPREELAVIRKTAQELLQQAQHYFQKKLLPKLDKEGIHVLEYGKLSKSQKERADKYFNDVVYPVLTPLALDPGHPFPHISNLSLNLAVIIRDKKGNEKFARIKIPDTLPRLIPIKKSSGSVRKDGTIPFHHYFVWLDHVIAANLSGLFPGLEVVSAHPFRIIRDADIEIQELEADDLLESMQQSIRKRKFGSVVQLAVHPSMPEEMRDLLTENLEVEWNDVYSLNHPLGLVNLWQLYNNVDRYDLKYQPYIQRIPKQLQKIESTENILDIIRNENILLHHPYESFSPVVDFLHAAARDPNVLAIKQTVYRVGANAPVVEALLEAAERGKQVAVLVELKARFDEESNIGWARALEDAGVHVVYGLVGLKTHCKIAMVVRKEGEGIRRYLHLATGNYNSVTSRIYEDVGLFTCDPDMGADATDLFNYLTGYSTKNSYKKLLVAPVNLRDGMEKLIRRETGHAKAGKKAHIIFKMNSLVDMGMIQLLYQASQAGVKVDLFVRGMCCLRPGIKGVSENIRVISIVGRYLEHSRIYYFLNDGNDEIYMGSADLMPRNLNHRVEVVFPVENKNQVKLIRDKILGVYAKDNMRARILKSNGTYERARPEDAAKVFDIQNHLMNK
ncbi:MAG: polyphosphate kinase 1 [Anaerolineales bacterium]|nr:polyphosphate kinase 1 [Anaerolineales bacterium]